MLKIDHISKTFYPGTENEKRALQDLSLTLDKGDFVTVIGSNGAGKSTLFNAIAGVWFTDAGRIYDRPDFPGSHEGNRSQPDHRGEPGHCL